MRTTAAAPSLMPEALPAVTLPSLSNAGFRLAIASSVVAVLRGYSSSANMIGSPSSTGSRPATISSLNLPAFCAASALFWLATANSSCSSRVTAYSFATFSAVTPMWYWLKTSHRPSTIIVSTIFASPMRKPSREPFSTCGDGSCSPGRRRPRRRRRRWRSPARRASPPCSPEPQTLLMVIAGTMCGMPALIAAWRAGFWPTPAVEHLAHDDLGDLLGRDAGALEHLADDDARRGRRPGVLARRAAELADGGARGADDDDRLPCASSIYINELVDSLLHVTAGRRLDRSVLDIRRRAEGALRRPPPCWRASHCAPLRPPAARHARARCRANVRRDPRTRALVQPPVAAAVLRGRIDHAGDVAARAEHERLVAPPSSPSDAYAARHGTMWSSRVANTNAGTSISPRSTGIAAHRQRARLAQLVLEIGVAQVPAVHRARAGWSLSAFQYSRSNAGGALPFR